MYVTLNRKGYLSLSRFTFEKMGSPERVLLLYDPPTNTIGITACGKMMDDAFPVHTKSNKQGRVIYALRLLQEFSIRLMTSVRFMDPHMDDDRVLILDLNNTRPTQKGQNGRVARIEN